MSRIDDAWRAWSGTPPAARAEDFALEDYPRESPAASIRRSPDDDPARRAVRSSAPGARRVRLVAVDGETRPHGLETMEVAAQYHRLAAALQAMPPSPPRRTLLVTSASTGERRVVGAVRLAMALAQASARVLIVDADLRSPSLHDALGLGPGCGVSDVLLSPDVQPSITQVAPLISVLPAGVPVPDPAALLTSPRLQQLLHDCAEAFDRLLVVAPAVAEQTGAAHLARLADGVVFVIEARSTPFGVVERATSQLGSAAIVGRLLDGFDEADRPP
jgi:Mrp family chromosome partitioning ATPase